MKLAYFCAAVTTLATSTKAAALGAFPTAKALWASTYFALNTLVLSTLRELIALKVWLVTVAIPAIKSWWP